MGARAAKGEGLKILWHRPSRVRIPSHALSIFFQFPDFALVAQMVERYLGKVEVGGSNPPKAFKAIFLIILIFLKYAVSYLLCFHYH